MSKPLRCKAPKCKKQKGGEEVIFRQCYVCGIILCRHCQEVIVNPAISYAETVFENYNPYGDRKPVDFQHLVRGENYNFSDYIAFCMKCSQQERWLATIKEQRDRMARHLINDEEY
jgi:hypothetical protein